MSPQFDFGNVIAHRGASAEYPENTWTAFEQARLQGAKWLEFDVWVNGDDVPVIFHDYSIERMTNGSGNIIEASTEYLSTLKIKHQGQLLEDEKIPYLEDMLAWLNQYQLGANIELKSLETVSSLQSSAKIICDLIKKFPTLSLVISSFSLPLLTEAREQLPQHALGLLVDIDCPEAWNKEREQYLKLFNQLNCYSLHVNQLGLDEQQTQQLKAQFACPLLSYTVNDTQRAEALLSWGVDAVFSDYPKLV